MQTGGDVIAAVVGALFPVRCAGCRRIADPTRPLCDACAAGLRRGPALAVPPGLDAWAAAFAYEGVAREIVARVKYRNERGAVPWLAAAMASALGELPGPGAVVTWVPASAGRRRRSGFDHGELLARAFARRVDLPAARLLVRDPGPAQTGLGRHARSGGPPLRPRGSAVRGRSIILVDDVVTTGATLGAAAAALGLGGASRVVAVTRRGHAAPAAVTGLASTATCLYFADDRCGRSRLTSAA